MTTCSLTWAKCLHTLSGRAIAFVCLVVEDGTVQNAMAFVFFNAAMIGGRRCLPQTPTAFAATWLGGMPEGLLREPKLSPCLGPVKRFRDISSVGCASLRYFTIA